MKYNHSYTEIKGKKIKTTSGNVCLKCTSSWQPRMPGWEHL